MYLIISLLVLLGGIAWQDHRKKEVADIFIVLLWFLAFIYGSLELLVLGFIFMWSYNLLLHNKMGWADITGFPAVASLLYIMFNQNVIMWGLGATCSALVLHYLFKGNVEIPAYVYVFYLYVICLLISCIAYI
jgi:hypothetical protein